MEEKVSFRTELGVVTAAKAEIIHDQSTNPYGGIELGKLAQTQTSGGLDILVSAVVGTDTRPPTGVGWIESLQKTLFDALSASTTQNIPALLREGLRAVNRWAHNDPMWRGQVINAVVAVVDERRIYLANTGSGRAYLIRGRQANLVTHDQPAPKLMGNETTQPYSPPNPVDLTQQQAAKPARNESLHIGTGVYLPDQQKQESLELNPGDGLILGTNGAVAGLLRQDALLGGDFFRYFQAQPVENSAGRLISIYGRQKPDENRSVIVLKSDESSVLVPIEKAGSCLSQVGILAIVLILSIGLGLGAAFGLPGLMNQKAVPNTGNNPPPPSGYITVDFASGQAQYLTPGQTPADLNTGSVIAAKDGMQILTGAGKAKVTLSDGTSVYINNASGVDFQVISDPKQNHPNTVLVMITGAIMVDSTHSPGDTTAVVTDPGGDAHSFGQFTGLVYTPSQKRLDVDCLQGGCQISGTQASRDLTTGQHSWVINGVIGGLDAARWNLWTSLCDSDCPIQGQQARPPQTTPTYGPTQQVPIPYLGQIPDTIFGAQSGVGSSSSGSWVDPQPTPIPVTGPITSPPVINPPPTPVPTPVPPPTIAPPPAPTPTPVPPPAVNPPAPTPAPKPVKPPAPGGGGGKGHHKPGPPGHGKPGG